MRRYRRHDYDESLDEESLFDDEEVTFERIGRRRARNSHSDQPRASRSDKPRQYAGESNRRRELENAWGAPY